MLIPYTKSGKSIRGTLERLSGVAEVMGKEDGELVYSGSTDVWWDEQETVTQAHYDQSGNEITSRVWVDEDGEELLESELVWKEEDVDA